MEVERADLSRAALSWPAVAALGALLTVLAFYPGFMNDDSAWQLSQAREGAYNSLHPPIMAFVWRPLDRVLPGPAGMFLFDTALFWTGLALLAFRLLPSRAVAAGAALAAGLYPPLFLGLSHIVKDTAMMAALLFASGMLLDARIRGSRLTLVLGLAGLF